MSRYIWIRGRRLYLYDRYSSWAAALKVAKYYQKKIKNHYFIIPYEPNFGLGDVVYWLYMDKVYGLR